MNAHGTLKRKLVLGLAGFLVALGVGAWVVRDNYVFLWDAYDHHGLFRCAVHQDADSLVVRQCWAGVDEPLLEEVRQPNGTVEERWFANMQEVLRVVRTSDGRSYTVHRQYADCWESKQHWMSEPTGRSGLACR